MTYRAKRRAVRIVFFILLYLIPFLKINGNPLLRFDFRELSIHILGVSLSPSHIFPVLLILLACLFFFIFATQLFGRLWCGWFCPQTNLIEIISDLSPATGKKDAKGVASLKKTANILIKLLVSFAFTAGLILYSMPPEDFISRLITGDISVIWAVAALVIFLELAFVGRIFCKTVCPYSNFQSIMFDADTMRIGLLPDRADDCIKCKACVRVCPTGLDIREGLNNKCVSCASCVDACIAIMGKLNKETCVGYFYGRQEFKPFAANKIITFAIAVVFLITGLVSFSKIGGLTIKPGEISHRENGYRFELTVQSSYSESTMVSIRPERKEAVKTPEKSYTLAKGESVLVPVEVYGAEADSVTLVMHVYQGRKESVQHIIVELK